VNCSNAQEDTPLITVVKLQSAESMANFEVAKNYIDINRVYSKYTESNTSEEEWRSIVEFFYNIGKDKKFTNCFKYYDFQISEEIDKNKAIVSFISNNPNSSIKKIIYDLELQEKKWLVVGIDYIK
jgi:hypothetical protein